MNVWLYTCWWCGCEWRCPAWRDAAAAGLSEELPDVSFVKIMGDHDADTRALMKEWGVRVVPLFMLFRNGEKVTEWSGAKPEVLRDNVIEACNDKEKATMVTV